MAWENPFDTNQLFIGHPMINNYRIILHFNEYLLNYKWTNE